MEGLVAQSFDDTIATICFGKYLRKLLTLYFTITPMMVPVQRNPDALFRVQNLNVNITQLLFTHGRNCSAKNYTEEYQVTRYMNLVYGFCQSQLKVSSDTLNYHCTGKRGNWYDEHFEMENGGQVR